MATRVVEGKKPYTGGEAIDINQNKVISLKLRDENNLIIYDSGDDEIYVDLQLEAGIEPTDSFPVGVNTGRVLVADGWDVTGTLLNAKTTSGDYIQILFGDNGKVFMDNGTGTFKEVSFKGEVPIASSTAPSDATEGMLWYDTDADKLKVYNGSAWVTVGGGGGGTGDVEGPNSAVDGHLAVFDGTSGKVIKDGGAIPVVPTDVSDFNNDAGYLTSSTGVTTFNGDSGAITYTAPVTSVNNQTGTVTLDADDISDSTTTNKFVTATDKSTWNGKQDELVSGTNIKTINNESLLGSGDITISGGGADIVYATQVEYDALPSSKLTDGKHYVIYTADTPTPPSPGWQPGADTIAYYKFNGNLNDSSSNNHNFSVANGTFTYNTLATGQKYAEATGQGCSNQITIPFDNSAYTINLWVKYISNGINGTIFLDMSQYSSAINRIRFTFENSGTKCALGRGTPVSGTFNVWNNIVVTLSNSGDLVGYLNGTQSVTFSGVQTYSTIDVTLNAACFATTPTNFAGVIDFSELIIEGKTRTATEILDYYNNTKANYGIS